MRCFAQPITSTRHAVDERERNELLWKFRLLAEMGSCENGFFTSTYTCNGCLWKSGSSVMKLKPCAEHFAAYDSFPEALWLKHAPGFGPPSSTLPASAHHAPALGVHERRHADCHLAVAALPYLWRPTALHHETLE